jgi:hypothetical protein
MMMMMIIIIINNNIINIINIIINYKNTDFTMLFIAILQVNLFSFWPRLMFGKFVFKPWKPQVAYFVFIFRTNILVLNLNVCLNILQLSHVGIETPDLEQGLSHTPCCNPDRTD